MTAIVLSCWTSLCCKKHPTGEKNGRYKRECFFRVCLFQMFFTTQELGTPVELCAVLFLELIRNTEHRNRNSRNGRSGPTCQEARFSQKVLP